MSVMETRGGLPTIRRLSIDTTGREVSFKGFSKYVQIVTGVTAVKIFFNEDDFNNDENYLLRNEWEGPVELRSIWLKGDGATSSVEMVIYLRR